MSKTTTQKPKPMNTQPIKIELKGEAGRRVLLNSARRVIAMHKKEIEALADK